MIHINNKEKINWNKKKKNEHLPVFRRIAIKLCLSFANIHFHHHDMKRSYTRQPHPISIKWKLVHMLSSKNQIEEPNFANMGSSKREV